MTPRKSPIIKLKIIKHSLGGNGVAGYYYTDFRNVSGVATDPDILTHVEEACEVEATGYHEKRPPKGGRKFMLQPRNSLDLDPNAILAIRSVIEDHRPGWVEEVREACRMFNHPRLIADWCELSVAVVVAIIENLKARGELPEGDFSGA